MPIDRFAAVSTFLRVAETGSFSAAGTALGLSPSAVSKQISHLEDRLGARLLNRTTRSVHLTDMGRAFLERGRAALTALEEAEAAVTDLTQAPRGTLRVSMPVGFGRAHVAPLIPDFLARHPDLSVELEQNDRLVNLVEEGFDVAVRMGDLADSSLIARRVAPMRRIVCASPGYLDRHGTPHAPRDLTDHACLVFAQAGRVMEWVFGDGADRHVVRVKGRLTSNSNETLIHAALAGHGLVRLSNYLLGEHFRHGRLVRLLEPYETHEAGVFAVYPAARHLSPKVRAFIDFLVDRLGRSDYWAVSGLE